MSKCEVANKGIENQVQFDIQAFRNNIVASVASMIGYPSKNGIKNASIRLKNSQSIKDKMLSKKQLMTEESKYKRHTELFDLLSSNIFKAGEAVQFDMNPMDVVDSWKVYFSKRQYGDLNPMAISQSPRLTKAILTRISKIEDKRERLMKSGKLNKREVALFPPEVIAITADKFGIMMKVIRKGLRLSDNEVSSVEKYASKFRGTLEKFKNNLTDNKQINKYLNLNDASAWGIEGFSTTINSPIPGEKVVIFGEGFNEGIDSYKIKQYNEDGTLEDGFSWLNKTDLNASPSDVKKQLIGFYLGNFVNEALDGRLRYVTLGSIPDMPIEDGERVITSERAEYDEKYGKRVQNLLNTMSEDYEHNQSEDDKRMTPNVHYVRSRNGKLQYKYGLFKTVDNNGKETYEAILLSKEPYRNEDPTKRENLIDKGYSASEWDNIRMEEGWYRAAEERYYGRLRSNFIDKKTKKKELIPNSHKKAWYTFQRLENQPPTEILEERTVGETDMESGYNNFWDTLRDMRATYEAVGDEVQSFNEMNNNRSLEIRDKISKRMSQKGMDEKSIEEALDKLFGIGGIRSKVFYNPPKISEDGQELTKGTIRTPTSYFMLKSDNYFPHVFHPTDLDTMIDNAIIRMETEIAESNFEKDSDDYKRLEEGLVHLQDMRQRQLGELTDDNPEAMTRLIEANSNVHMKHISAWTDATYMRTDADVHGDYLKRIFGALHKNDLMADTVGAVDKLLQMEKTLVPEGSIDYLINRVKMSVGDSDTRATTLLFGKETGYESMANKINKLPSSIRGGTVFTAESAEKLTKWINSLPSMRFLDSKSAAGNLTQIMNQVIANGYGTFFEASKLLNGEFTKNKWESIVNGTGVLNQLSMFNDIMLQNGEVEWNDFGLFPGINIPSRNMTDLIKLLSKGRESFILNENADIDNFLMNLESRNRGILRDNIVELKKLEKQRKEILQRKRGEFFDAFAIEEKDNKDAIVMKRFKKLIGEISDQKIRQMVSWKLSWHWEPLKGAFTFTGTEQNLRSITAVMALLDAEKRGILGGDIDINGSKGDGSIFKTDRAKKIARDAVYNTQFGMTPQYLGEAFNGFGRAVYQYKPYVVQQMEHDYSVMLKFFEGSYSNTDSIIRITSAIKDAIVSSNPLSPNRKSYNPADPNLDHEALAASRLIFSRFSASAIASFTGIVPGLSWMLRKFGHQSFSLLRSFENPAMGIAMRTSIWGVLLAMGADEDDEKLKDLLGDFSFILLPVMIGMIGRDIYSGVDWLSQD